MKKIIYLMLLIVIILTSCEKNLYVDTGDYSNLDNFITTEVRTFYADNTSVALVDGDTLAVFQGEICLQVPKHREVKIEEVINSSEQISKGRSKIWHVIAFEDTREGDHDYNDLIIHSLFEIKNNKAYVYIHPIAYGAKKTISLGFEIYDNKKNKIGEKIYKNVKQELFSDSSNDFINTIDYDRCYFEVFNKNEFTACKNGTGNYTIVWYIICDKKVLYAVNTFNHTSMFDKDGYPFGLVITNCAPNGYPDVQHKIVGKDWFRYPLETVNIRDCYNFDEWAKGNWDYTILDESKVMDVTKTLECGHRIYDVKN